jgi:hypothetical protein
LIRRTIHKASAWALFCGWAFIATACSITPLNPLSRSGPPRGLNAFMGVRFGDSFDDVERRLPLGARETSPYGAPAYKVENVSSGSVEYQDVIFEFAEGAGMQMAIAHFAPSANADVLQQLQTTLGAPSSTGGSSEGTANVDAVWQLSDGSRVLFSGEFHRLALLGKEGKSLEVDIRLRDQAVPAPS